MASDTQETSTIDQSAGLAAQERDLRSTGAEHISASRYPVSPRRQIRSGSMQPEAFLSSGS